MCIWLKIFFTIATVVVCPWRDARAQDRYQHVYDRATPRDKGKLATLCHELVAEAKHRIHQTDALRDGMSMRPGFQVGVIMGQIREKYKTMLELYRQTKNKYTGRSKLVVPEVPEMRPIHYLWRMEYISALERDIERLVHILHQIPVKDDPRVQLEGTPMNLSRPDEQTPAGVPPESPKLRMGGRSEELDFSEAILARKEEEVKRGYREQFVMKRIGLQPKVPG